MSELAGTEQFVPLLEAGVRLWAYQPTMLHLKMMTVDGVTACIGSPNVNRRSMRHDDEIALVVLDEKLVRQLDQDFEKDLANSKPITLNDVRSRGVFRRMREAIVQPFRPLV